MTDKDAMSTPMSHNGYTVERHPHGLVVVGPIPVREVIALAAYGEALGYTVVDAGLSEALGVTMVITGDDDQKAWRTERGLPA